MVYCNISVILVAIIKSDLCVYIHKQLNFLGYGYGYGLDTHNWQYTRDNWKTRVSNWQFFQLSRVYCQLWVSHPYPYPYLRKFSCSCLNFTLNWLDLILSFFKWFLGHNNLKNDNTVLKKFVYEWIRAKNL